MSSEVASTTTVSEKTDNNPGTYEELHRKCRDLFPICFDGAKVMVMKSLSSHFQVNYLLNFCHKTCILNQKNIHKMLNDGT